MRESQLLERGPDIGFTFSTECSSVNTSAFESSDFSSDHFKHMPNSHTAWDRMGIDDKIWTQSVFSKGHIFLVGN